MRDARRPWLASSATIPGGFRATCKKSPAEGGLGRAHRPTITLAATRGVQSIGVHCRSLKSNQKFVPSFFSLTTQGGQRLTRRRLKPERRRGSSTRVIQEAACRQPSLAEATAVDQIGIDSRPNSDKSHRYASGAQATARSNQIGSSFFRRNSWRLGTRRASVSLFIKLLE